MSLSIQQGIDLKFRKIEIRGYEEVVEAIDEPSGLHAIISIHSTKLGPAAGGVRIYPYRSFDEALAEVLALSRSMTYKAVLAKTGTGGGKSVILAEGGAKSPALLHAFGQFVDHFQGRYYATEDMGCGPKDLGIMREKTPYILGLEQPGSSGDPARFTAFGILAGMRALGPLRGKTVAIQGLGAVGMKLAAHLFWEGASLVVTDIDPHKVALAVREWEAEPVALSDIYSVSCDIFCPCSIRAVLHAETISQLKCEVVAGAANNQLGEDTDAELLHKRSILYLPDYIINAGGLICITSELGTPAPSPIKIRDRTEEIGKTVEEVLSAARSLRISPLSVANRIAEEKLSS